jgi:hypothetical protein
MAPAIPRVGPLSPRMSLAGVDPAARPPLWLGLWGRLRCAPTPSHTCSQPIPSVLRPSFTFSDLIAVLSLADLGYLSRPPRPPLPFPCQKVYQPRRLSSSLHHRLFLSCLFGLHLYSPSLRLVHCNRSFLLDHPHPSSTHDPMTYSDH